MTGSSTADGVEFGLVVVLRFSFSFKLFVTLFWEATTRTQRRAHDPPRIPMFYNATLGVETRSRKRKRERDANAGEVIPGLLNDILVTHVLRSEYFDDPADLARLPAVSRAMRDAVAATGRHVALTFRDDAVKVGCLSAVERLQRRGILGNQSYLCHAAARSGQLEKLKVLRENDTP